MRCLFKVICNSIAKRDLLNHKSLLSYYLSLFTLSLIVQNYVQIILLFVYFYVTCVNLSEIYRVLAKLMSARNYLHISNARVFNASIYLFVNSFKYRLRRSICRRTRRQTQNLSNFLSCLIVTILVSAEKSLRIRGIVHGYNRSKQIAIIVPVLIYCDVPNCQYTKNAGVIQYAAKYFYGIFLCVNPKKNKHF